MEVRLFSRRSGKCVSIIDYSRDDGANAVQSVCGANFANEIFKLEPASEEGFYYLKAAHSGKCLEVADASTADHANVQQSACADARRRGQPEVSGYFRMCHQGEMTGS